MRPISAGMDHPLGDALVIEMEYLLTEMEVVHKKRAAWSDTQRILVVGDRSALRGRQHRIPVLRHLVEFTTLPAHELLIVDRRAGAGRT